MSASLEVLQYLALAVTAVASAGWIGRHWHRAVGDLQVPLFCCLLAFVLAAAAGLSGAAHLGLGLDTRAARIWFEQATFLLGLPLAALACLALARDWHWGRPTWGRLVIGLCVFFALARGLGWSQPYAIGLGLGSALLVGYAGLFRRPLGPSLAIALAAALLLLVAVPFPRSALLPWRMLALALATPLLAVLVAGLSDASQHRTPPAS